MTQFPVFPIRTRDFCPECPLMDKIIVYVFQIVNGFSRQNSKKHRLFVLFLFELIVFGFSLFSHNINRALISIRSKHTVFAYTGTNTAAVMARCMLRLKLTQKPKQSVEFAFCHRIALTYSSPGLDPCDCRLQAPDRDTYPCRDALRRMYP